MNEPIGLYIALYTDEDVTADLAVELRKQNYPAQSAAEAGLLEVDDEIQMEYAVEHRMCILSYNVKHFPKIATRFANEGRNHYGIAVSTEQFSKEQFGELLRLTIRFLETYDAEQMMNRLVYLQEFK